jgi:hypothetical protein
MIISGTSFSAGDSLLIDYRVRNLNTTRKIFYFNNAQQFGYTVVDSRDNQIKRYPEVILPATTSFTLDYSQSKSFSAKIIFGTENGDNPWLEGRYSITGYLLDKHSTDITLTFNIK